MLCIDVCVESPVGSMGDSSHKNTCGMTSLLLWFVQQIMVEMVNKAHALWSHHQPQKH